MRFPCFPKVGRPSMRVVSCVHFCYSISPNSQSACSLCTSPRFPPYTSQSIILATPLLPCCPISSHPVPHPNPGDELSIDRINRVCLCLCVCVFCVTCANLCVTSFPLAFPSHQHSVDLLSYSRDKLQKAPFLPTSPPASARVSPGEPKWTGMAIRHTLTQFSRMQNHALHKLK